MTNDKSRVHHKFREFAVNNKLFIKNKSVLAAISGGQDSICLLKLLKDYQVYHKLEIHIIHFDHGWRNDSRNNSTFVQNIAQRWSMFFHQKSAKKVLSEADAREWRYLTMRELCHKLNIRYIITGHTLTDKLETILLNILKGTSFEGIQALQPHVKISDTLDIVHPLLHIKREETLWFCRKFSLPIWSDITNYKKEIKRNRMREELIPYFKQYFNLNFEYSLFKFVENIGYDLDYLQERTYYLYNKCKHPQHVGINKTVFLSLTLTMQRRIMRAFIYHNTQTKLNFVETKECIFLVKSPNVQIRQISLLWYLYANHNWVYLLSHKTV